MSQLTVRGFLQSQQGLSTATAGYGDGNPNINHD